MATVLVQTENRPKTTNGAHAVSNFTQIRGGSLQRDFQKKQTTYPKCCICFPLSNRCSLKQNKRKHAKINISATLQSTFAENS